MDVQGWNQRCASLKFVGGPLEIKQKGALAGWLSGLKRCLHAPKRFYVLSPVGKPLGDNKSRILSHWFLFLPLSFSFSLPHLPHPSSFSKINKHILGWNSMKSPNELVQLEKRGAQGQTWKPSIFRKKKKRVEENQPRNMRREQNQGRVVT